MWRVAGHGPDLVMELTHVYTLRERKVFGLEFFWDHEEALKVAGLRR